VTRIDGLRNFRHMASLNLSNAGCATLVRCLFHGHRNRGAGRLTDVQ
jgi:hypothetical protein